MKRNLFVATSIVFLSFLAGCAGGKSGGNGENLEIPTNMPPICRDIDFVAQPDMREMCGVRVRHSKAYRNIPLQRYLIKPAETSIVKTNGQLELRFQNSLPLILDGPIVDEMVFNQDKRLEKIKNTYDYHEIYTKNSGRVRIFKMGIPTDAGNIYSFCYNIPEKKGNARTRSVAMGNRIEAMSCADFDRLVAENTKKK